MAAAAPAAPATRRGSRLALVSVKRRKYNLLYRDRTPPVCQRQAGAVPGRVELSSDRRVLARFYALDYLRINRPWHLTEFGIVPELHHLRPDAASHDRNRQLRRLFGRQHIVKVALPLDQPPGFGEIGDDNLGPKGLRIWHCSPPV